MLFPARLSSVGRKMMVQICKVTPVILHGVVSTEDLHVAGAGRFSLQPHILQPQSFFFTLVTGPRRSLSLKLSDTRVYEPQSTPKSHRRSPKKCFILNTKRFVSKIWRLFRTKHVLNPRAPFFLSDRKIMVQICRELVRGGSLQPHIL